MKNIFKYFLTLIFSAVYLNPGYSALPEPEQFLYITPNVSSGGIIELNTKTRALTIIPTNAKAYSSVISPDGKLLYTCNQGADAITVIRLSDHTTIATIAVGDNPSSLAITPDGHFLYVANKNADNVSVIDTTTNTEVTSDTTRIPTGDSPVAIAIRPQGDIAYIANNVSHDVSVIDLSSNTAATPIPITTPNITDIAFSPDGKSAYVISYNSANGKLTTIDVANSIEIIPSVGVGDYLMSITVSPDGKTAYIGRNAYSHLEIMDLSIPPPVKIKKVNVFAIVAASVVSPNGEILYFSHSNSTGTLSTLDTLTHSEITSARMDLGYSLYGKMTITPSVPLVQLHSYRTDSFTDSDVYNTVSWSQPVSAFPLHYEIYRDKALTQLAKSIPCDVPGNCQQSYEDHNLIRHKTYEYYVAAKNDYGIVSIGSASITTG